MELNLSAKLILETLRNNGFEAYLVGGCSRDLILGLEPKDWDICTNAMPEQVKEVFSEYMILEIGIAYGTVTVVIDHEHFEITTYRVDGEYKDGRHPTEVSLTTDLKKDLSRRDFTINAMAMDESGIIDYFGGKEDIQNKIIKCVGNPIERFNEDRLRILRAIRFACKLGFKIEENTLNAMKQFSKDTRNKVSPERLQMELIKTIDCKYIFEVLSDETMASIFFDIFPEFKPMFKFKQNNPHHIYDVWEHTLKAITFSDGYIQKLVALMHDMGKPIAYSVDENGKGHFYGHPFASAKLADKFMRELNFSNYEREFIISIIQRHHDTITPTKKSLLKYLSKVDISVLYGIISFREADTLAQSDYERESKFDWIKQIQSVIADVLTNNSSDKNNIFSIKDLDINGNDIKELGFSEGKIIGNILKELLNAVIEEKCQNTREQLIVYVQNKSWD